MTYRLGFGALGLLVSLSAVGCGEGSDLDDQSFTPPPMGDAGLTSDASAVTTPDTGLPPTGSLGGNDSGVVAPIDSGAAQTDTGTTLPEAAMPQPDGGAPDTGAPDTGVQPTRPDQGMGDGKDVVTIGDSWMNLNNSVGIQQSLEKASKRDYRNYGVPGTKLLDEVIPNQYVKAKGEGSIKTVVMTAGGNDVLQDATLGPINLFGPGCKDGIFNDACKKRIDEVAARLQKLWAQMATDGVNDVVIISYSNKTLGGEYKMVSSYSAEKITPLCNNVPAPLRCSSFDTDMGVSFKDRGDAIHPDDATYDAIGAGVWKLMQEKGMRR